MKKLILLALTLTTSALAEQVVHTVPTVTRDSYFTVKPDELAQSQLNIRLTQGWQIRSITPIIARNGVTSALVYLLEK